MQRNPSGLLFKTIFILLTILNLAMPKYAYPLDGPSLTPDDFISTWKTDISGSPSDTSITIQTIGGGYSYQIDWNNDGDLNDSGEATVHTGDVTHNYETLGTYQIRIVGALSTDKLFF